MSTYRPALLGLCAALVLAYPLHGSPRRDTSRTESKEESTSTSTSQPTASAPTPGTLPPPVMTRRIITKVDGVIVDERDAAPLAAPILPPSEQKPGTPQERSGPDNRLSPKPGQVPQPPEGVVYGEVIFAEDSGTDEEAFVSDEAPEPDTQEELVESSSGGIFDNFFNPTRSADINGMRFGKRRGSFIGPEGSSETIYTPLKVPEPTEESPFIAPSRNLIVGEVVLVDQARGIVVAWMQTRFITLDRNVITRNHELETTAVLRPTGFRNGRAYGLDIAVGQPMVGDEVVLADAGPARRRQDDLSVNVTVQVEPSSVN